MRLIDAEALKEDLKQYFSDGVLDSVSAKIAFSMVLRKIDNAPTVKTYCYFCGQTEHGQIEERPQCEWIEFADFIARNVVSEDFSEDVDFYAEVLCRKLVKLGLVKLDGDTYKYCGADMRGEEE